VGTEIQIRGSNGQDGAARVSNLPNDDSSTGAALFPHMPAMPWSP
jgi:hypothetical protein